jgi:hypothetical protein
MKKIRVLFICKRRSTYGVSYGLLNSCRFLVNALVDMGYEAKVVEVTDNNDIDREVTLYKPTHVFIEALWVVPSKFEELIPLHPQVKWYVRLHSNTPFIANEGMAIDWIVKYLALGVRYPLFVAPNAELMCSDIDQTYGVHTTYAPNIYQPFQLEVESVKAKPPHPPHPEPPHPPQPPPPPPCPHTLDIGCFGAIRPLKNQLIQAMAAVTFANKLNRQLTFHINSTRVEQHGQPILRNLEALFATTRHRLAVHDWLPWNEFIQLVRTMDLGLQVSFSETFDIVAADFVFADVPIVGSKEIPWLSHLYQADCTNMDNIVSHLEFAWQGKKFGLHSANRVGLREWNEAARKAWKQLLQHG